MEPSGFAGPVTALAYSLTHSLLIGTGPYLGLSTCRAKTYAGFQVLGIRVRDQAAAAWGGNVCAMLTLSADGIVITGRYVGKDWIRDAKLLPDYVLVAYAKGEIEVLELPTLRLQSTLIAPGFGVLYSTEMHGDDLVSLVVASGTAYKTISVWSPGGGVTLLEGHKGAVFRVRFSADGAHLLSVSDDRSVKLWDVRTRTCELTLVGHSARVWDAGFLGSLLASISEDCTLRIWQHENCIRILTGHCGRNVWSLAIDSEGTQLATGGQDGLIVQWAMRAIVHPRTDWKTYQENQRCVANVPDWDGSEIVAIAMNEDFLFFSTSSGKVYCLARDSSYEEVRLIRDFSAAISAIACSESTLAVGDSKGNLVFLDLKSGEIVSEQSVSSLRICDIFSVRHSVCFWLSTSPKGEVVLWGKTSVLRRVEIPAAERVFAANLTREFLIAGDAVGSVYVFTLTSFEILHQFLHVHNRCRVASIVIEAERMYTVGRDGKINCFHMSESGIAHDRIKEISGGVKVVERFNPRLQLALAFQKSALLVCDTCSDAVLTTIECVSPRLPYSWDVNAGRVTLCYSLKHSLAIHTGTIENSAFATPTDSGATLFGTRCHGREILCAVALTIGGKEFVVTGSEDTFIKVFQLGADLECVETASGHPSAVRALAVYGRETDHYLVSGGGKMALFLWQVSLLGESVRVQKLSSMRLNGELDQRVMCLDMNVQWVIAGDSGNGLSLLEITEMHPGAKLQFRFALQSASFPSVILCAKLFSADSQCYAASGTSSGYLRIHRVPTGDFITEIKLHQLGVDCMALFPENDPILIATGGDDQAVVLTAFVPGCTVTTVVRLPLAHDSAVKGLAVRGASLISVSWDGRICMWTLPALSFSAAHSHFVGDCAALVAVGDSAVVCGLGLERFRILQI